MRTKVAIGLWTSAVLAACSGTTSTGGIPAEPPPEEYVEPNQPENPENPENPDNPVLPQPDVDAGANVPDSSASTPDATAKPDSSTPPPPKDGGAEAAKPDSATSTGGTVGNACTASSQCAGGANAFCITEAKNGWPGGYCATTACSEQNKCAAGADCYDVGGDTTMCLKVCAKDTECRAGYICHDTAKACAPGCTSNDDCDSGETCESDGRCKLQPCTATSCQSGYTCNADKKCVPVLPAGPGKGPGPTCTNLPARDCTGTSTYCGELIQFDPSTGVGYEDYPLNGETSSNQYRSWIRRDVSMLVKWTAAYVDCKSKNWDWGTKKPLALGDMSEKNGAIPGTSVGQPGHPAGTHVNGFDMDIGYYQIGSTDNRLRPICEHTSGGKDQYHCVKSPHLLDVWRTALALGAMFSSPRVRVIGVDGQAGPLIEEAMTQLCTDGWLSGDSCDKNNWALAYETTDQGRGWYYFHHHHFHISISPPTGTRLPLLWADGKSQRNTLGRFFRESTPGHAHVHP